MQYVKYLELILLYSVTIFSLLFGNGLTFITSPDLNKFIYMIICNFNKSDSNRYVKWTKISGQSYLLTKFDTILIRSWDYYGSYKYACSHWIGNKKLSEIVFSFELKSCTNNCWQSASILVYFPQSNIQIVYRRPLKTRQGRRILAVVTRAPLSEPNIHFYLIAVALSVVLAIIIVILCIMCYEPYEKSLSDASIEDESVQANIKVPPCDDLLKIDGADDKTVCKEFKKSAYDHLNGSRRTFFTIENMAGNVSHEGDGICPLNPDSKNSLRAICPMNQQFRQPVQATCPSCPNIPDPNPPCGYQVGGCPFTQELGNMPGGNMPTTNSPQIVLPQGPYQNYQNFPHLREEELSQNRQNLLPIVSSSDTGYGFQNDQAPAGQAGRYPAQPTVNNYQMIANGTRPSMSTYTNTLQPNQYQKPCPHQKQLQAKRPQQQLYMQPNNNQMYPGGIQSNPTYMYPGNITNSPVFVNAPEPSNSPIFVNAHQPLYQHQQQIIQQPAQQALPAPHNNASAAAQPPNRVSQRPPYDSPSRPGSQRAPYDTPRRPAPKRPSEDPYYSDHVRDSSRGSERRHGDRRISSSTRTSDTYETDDTHTRKCRKYAKNRVKERRPQ